MMTLNQMFDTTGWFMRKLPPETAHKLTLIGLKLAPVFGPMKRDDPALSVSAFGLNFPNPVGLAAGFDKDAEVYRPMLKYGFGHVEVGTITPRPQPGNPAPRIFRLSEDNAVINRLGFPSQGLDSAVDRLARRQRRQGIIGGNIGKNKESEEAGPDYLEGLNAIHGLVDYITVNISSPNTPGLRDLQGKDALDKLLGTLIEARDGLGAKPLLVKIAPDVSDEELDDICQVALARNIDGLIVSNTTISRPSHLRNAQAVEMGGLSGAPLKPLALDILTKTAKRTDGQITLIAAGGIASADDAYARIRAGASLVQLYTAMIYDGPLIAAKINQGLLNLVHRDGFARVQDAIGADLK